jgi:hypothetical protein
VEKHLCLVLAIEPKKETIFTVTPAEPLPIKASAQECSVVRMPLHAWWTKVVLQKMIVANSSRRKLSSAPWIPLC